MNADLDEVARRLDDVATYRRGFDQAFPGEGLTADTLLVAIATFERTVVSGWSPFDRWVDGDADAISPEAQRGFELFVGDGRCADCHSGWNFTDNLFHDIGLPSTDLGRAGIAEARVQDRHAFKTPGLRNITQRAPYMHDGSMPDLESVMAHYVSGGIQRDSLSPRMHPLALGPEEVAAVIAFMETLTAENSAVPTPTLPVD